ncbi:MAG TPA: protein-disulfide reductase DsbD domain-containing protein [Pyrinomonadaceae bacterium]|jgi:DsbC/DsbD-like thiol-disulfide interchange protein
MKAFGAKPLKSAPQNMLIVKRRQTSTLLACALLLLAVACSRQAPADVSSGATNTPTPANSGPAEPAANPTPAEIVRASADEVALKAGGRGEARVRLQIADGYHINANPATFAYLKATELEFTPTAGVTAGKPAYPQPVNRKFHFAPEALAVYEHEATIRLPLSVQANAPKGAQTLHAQVHVQACDEEKCFPPTKIATDIPLTIN